MSDDQFNALLHNKTWTLVPLHRDCSSIGCKWIYWIKQKLDGSMDRYEACLVAKGLHQCEGLDYFEPFSLVVKPITIRTIVTLAMTNNWPIRQMDVQIAFLNWHLKKEVYIVQSSGFVDVNHPNYVCELNWSLYGLKQSPRAWYSRLSGSLHDMGFTSSQADTSLFIKLEDHLTIFILIYVNDIIIIGSSSFGVQLVINKLGQCCSIKVLFICLNTTFTSLQHGGCQASYYSNPVHVQIGKKCWHSIV